MSNRMGTGLLFALVGLLVLTGLYSPVGAQPNFTTILVDDNVDNGSTSIAFDSRGHPHIAYYDITYSSSVGIKHAWHDGRSWHYEIVDRVRHQGKGISLALDSQDRPHLAYLDRGDAGTTETTLFYAFFDGHIWRYRNIETAANAPLVDFQISLSPRSLALDANSNRHLSYNLFKGELKYASSGDGLTWTIAIRQSSSVNFPKYMMDDAESPLALDKYDHPQILYSQMAEFNTPGQWLWELKISYFDSNTYQNKVLTKFDGWGIPAAMEIAGL